MGMWHNHEERRVDFVDVEVVEKSAYDAAVERAERAERERSEIADNYEATEREREQERIRATNAEAVTRRALDERHEAEGVRGSLEAERDRYKTALEEKGLA